MRRVSIVGLLFLALIGTAAVVAVAGDAPPVAENGQSMAAPAAGAEHDHESTCGSGGACCSACQIRQKYAKAKSEDEAGGCPCQRAKQAREQAARERAAAPAD